VKRISRDLKQEWEQEREFGKEEQVEMSECMYDGPEKEVKFKVTDA